MDLNEKNLSALSKLLITLIDVNTSFKKITVFQSPPNTTLQTVILNDAARLIYVHSGILHYKVNGRNYFIDDQSIVIIGQHCKFEISSLSKQVHEFILSYPSIWYIQHKIQNSDRIIPIPYVGNDNESQFIDYWRALTTYSEKSDEYNKIKHNCLTTLLFNEMKLYFTNYLSLTKRVNNNKVLLLSILTYMAENFKMGLNRLEICNKFNITYKRMSALFMHWQRCNFKQTLIQLRLNHARGLLITTDKTISEIAISSGFNSPDHFIYCFRQIFGLSPYQLKKRTFSRHFTEKKDRMTLHNMEEFYFLNEYKADDLPNLKQDVNNAGTPTVCYFANESGDDRYLYEVYAGSREVFVTTIKNYRRYRFNVSVGTVYRAKNKQGDICSTFIIDDRLCQGIFTL